MQTANKALSPLAHEAASASEAVEAALSRIAVSEQTVKAWVHVDAHGAREAAKLRDELDSAAHGELEKIVVGVKDVIDVQGMATRSGSAARQDAGPAAKDAAVVKRLRKAGAIILGKVTTTEFAYLDPAETTNPANPKHTPGGSSSGSAAAVAAGHVPLALGTQTVGSVCRPAAYCGVPAFKPSTGSMPSEGVTPFSAAFDTVGFLARTMSLAVTASRVSAGLGRTSSTALNPNGLRIGVLQDPFYTDVTERCWRALTDVQNALHTAGATIVPVRSGVDFQAMREAQRTVMWREAAMAHTELLLDPSRFALLGENWANALRQGSQTSESQYVKARDRLVTAKHALAALFDEVDFLLMPPVRSPAPEGLKSTGDAGLIAPWTIFGSPLAVLPAGNCKNGLPLAVMLAGRPWMDEATGKLAVFAEKLIGGE